MLQRLAGAHEVESLQTFAEMLEPVKGYDRENFGPYTTSTPLIRLVDAIPPESSAALRFAAAVDAAIKTNGPWDDVRLQLAVWHANHSRLQPVLAQNELFADVSLVAANSFEMTGLGLEVLDALTTGRAPGAAWKQQRTTLLHTLAIPDAAVQLAITPAITKLIATLPE